jgi:hypothetical protein
MRRPNVLRVSVAWGEAPTNLLLIYCQLPPAKVWQLVARLGGDFRAIDCIGKAND